MPLDWLHTPIDANTVSDLIAKKKRTRAIEALRAQIQGEGVPNVQTRLQLADLLVANDLRGVSSHGSMQMARYARELRSGELNPEAEVTVVRETPSSLLLDGGALVGISRQGGIHDGGTIFSVTYFRALEDWS